LRVALIFVLVAIWGAPSGGTAGTPCPPPVMLWAWERPDDLSQLDAADAGVAYLAKTVFLSADDVIVKPRRQPLRLPELVYLVPVVRIEAPRAAAPSLSAPQRAKLTAELLALARPGTPALQIDFDATFSQRTFYRLLLADVRAGLRPGTMLSITALASWALADTWIGDAPVDEAVPMLFRMGVDGDHVRRHLARGGDFRPALARTSFGISIDEPLRPLPAGRRVYIFHSQPWTTEAAKTVIREVKQWQGPVFCRSS
jgi:hypothetical protein